MLLLGSMWKTTFNSPGAVTARIDLQTGQTLLGTSFERRPIFLLSLEINDESDLNPILQRRIYQLFIGYELHNFGASPQDPQDPHCSPVSTIVIVLSGRLLYLLCLQTFIGHGELISFWDRLLMSRSIPHDVARLILILWDAFIDFLSVLF